MIPSSKLSPLVLISWIAKKGYINIFPGKKKKKRPWHRPCRLPCSSAQPLNQKTLFLHSGLSVGIIKDPRGHAGSVQTQACKREENKSYGNVAKFWDKAVTSTWNSARGSLPWNPRGQKGTSVSFYPRVQKIISLTHRLSSHMILWPYRLGHNLSAFVKKQVNVCVTQED